MKRMLKLYAAALGGWVLVLIVVSAVVLLAVAGVETPNRWSLVEVQGTGPVSVSTVWGMWAWAMAIILGPPAVGVGLWMWWRGRGGQAA